MWQAAQRKIEGLQHYIAVLRDYDIAALRDENIQLKRQVVDLCEEKSRRQGKAVVSTHRNIFYSEDTQQKRLPLYDEPDREKPGRTSMAFGECFAVDFAVVPQDSGHDTWLKVLCGEHKDKWVLAIDAGTVNCVEMTQYPPRPGSGRIRSTQHAGQNFSHKLYSEGYAGPAEVCLISASGDSLWKEINVEMLFRGIATATVFEEEWCGDDTFTEWVTHYAVNCIQHAQLGTPFQKSLQVTVKPTERWANYTKHCCGPDLDTVRDDIGKAQYKECDWLKGMMDKLHINWDKVEFVTGFTFLCRYCAWTKEDCKQAANERLLWVLDTFFNDVPQADARYEWECAYWLWDEAFHDDGSFDTDARDTARELALLCADWGISLSVPPSLRGASSSHAVDWAELAAVAPQLELPVGRIAAGHRHGLALVGGTLRTWGNDGLGQCRMPSLAPGEKWLAVSAGGYHNLGLTASGRLKAWGSDDEKRCTGAPELVQGDRWAAVSAGRFHSLGLTESGRLHAWGDNFDKVCNVPSLPQHERWAARSACVSAGWGHCLGITVSGALHAWGHNGFGQCTGKPLLANGQRWSAVSAGTRHSLGLSTDGRLHAWGSDQDGRCSGSPALAGDERWVAISAGDDHSLGLTSAGAVHGWGSNHSGQCNPPRLLPRQRWLAISAGHAFSLGLTSAGEVKAWGGNEHNQVSDVPGVPR